MLDRVDRAIISALDTSHPRQKLVEDVLSGLTYGDRERLLLLSLDIGFRHLEPGTRQWDAETHCIPHTELHQELVGIIFRSNKSEGIADLLCAFTASYPLVPTFLSTFSQHVVELRNNNATRFSPRLRQHAIYYVELVGCDGLWEVGTEIFVAFLNFLHVGVEDVKASPQWALLLLETMRSPEASQHLSTQSWALLTELAIFRSLFWRDKDIIYNPYVTDFLLETQEWDKLECWVVWPPETDNTAEDLVRAMVSLFRQQPSAVQKLAERVVRSAHELGRAIPGSFSQILQQMFEEARIYIS